jgi:hypothetical protein
MNSIIKRLPDTIPTAHIVSSAGCTGQDAAHFDSPGYRKFGRRYGVEMLSLLGYKATYTEAECGTIGANISFAEDNNASNSAYVTASKKLTTPPTDDKSVVRLALSLSTDTTYYLYGRLKNSNLNPQSFWYKIDNGEFHLHDSLNTNGWEWVFLRSIDLTAGDHTISFAFADDSVMLDKIVIKNAQIRPVDVGEEAKKVCTVDFTAGLNDLNFEGYVLEQNFPNPVTSNTVNFSFIIPNTSFVSLKLYNTYGIAIDDLAAKTFFEGEHVISYDIEKLTPGIYFYTMQADKYFATRKMIVPAK